MAGVSARGRWCLRAAVVGLSVAAVSGCASQVSALAPVGGDDITAVRNAAIDVVTGHTLLVKDAPRCTQVVDRFSCVGSITDGSPIVVDAPVDGSTMTVTVGATVLYSGPVQDVLDAASRGEPVPTTVEP
jgi:hypothetical protein